MNVLELAYRLERRTKPMTVQELTERLAEGESALELSIEKWERLRSKCKVFREMHKEALRDGSVPYEIRDKVCGLCCRHRYHHIPMTCTSISGQDPCPLIDADGKGCEPNSLWWRCFKAIERGTYIRFLWHSWWLVRRMKKARRWYI